MKFVNNITPVNLNISSACAIITIVKLTAKIKLQPNTEQHQALKDTIKVANEACDYISQIAWDNKTFGKFKIQKLVYHDVKAKFGLTAQVVIRCIAKVTDAYKLDKKTKRTFSELGAIPFDDRILRYWLDDQRISIWTVEGRQKMNFVAGDRQIELLQNRQGESDLALIDGQFYLFSTCDAEEGTPADVTDVLGVDLGIVQIASDSDGNQFSGSQVNSIRKRRQRQRKRLQSKGTKSAKRVLKSIRRKESRFVKDVNHTISKRIVEKAKRTNRAIALEDLKGIRSRIRARKSQRYTLHSWSFYDLIQKIKYKAKLAGVMVIDINPRNTSKTCSHCGHCSKSNRKSQSEFLCVSCGFAANADTNAALNISAKGWGVLSSTRTEHVLPQTFDPLMSTVGSA